MKRIDTKNVLSVTLANLDIFEGEKLSKELESSAKDGKIELLFFSTATQHKKVASITESVSFSFGGYPANTVFYLELGSNKYRLVNPV